MFEISVEAHFYASHKIRLPDGSMEASHYHDWSVTAILSREKLNNIGIVMNFQKLRELMDEITHKFNHKSLNEFEYFKQNNPTAEIVARYIFEKLEKQIPKNVKLEAISVVEEPGCIAKFRR